MDRKVFLSVIAVVAAMNVGAEEQKIEKFADFEKENVASKETAKEAVKKAAKKELSTLKKRIKLTTKSEGGQSQVIQGIKISSAKPIQVLKSSSVKKTVIAKRGVEDQSASAEHLTGVAIPLELHIPDVRLDPRQAHVLEVTCKGGTFTYSTNESDDLLNGKGHLDTDHGTLSIKAPIVSEAQLKEMPSNLRASYNCVLLNDRNELEFDHDARAVLKRAARDGGRMEEIAVGVIRDGAIIWKKTVEEVGDVVRKEKEKRNDANRGADRLERDKDREEIHKRFNHEKKR